jgi:uncharacterized protein YidB (DUF937 family)
MSFFEDILRQVVPQAGQGQPVSSAIGAVLMDQIFGQHAAAGTAAPAPGTGNLADGLGGLISRMQQAGLGDVAKSWIENGANQPIDAQKIGMVLGDEAITVIAARTGLSPDVLQTQLAKYLPEVIDRLTPHGRLPTRQDATQTPGA